MAALGQLVDKYFKRCFTCGINKPLFLFKTNNKKYQLVSDKNKMVNCKKCETKRLIKQQGEIIKYNFITNKYDTINLKINMWNILKYYFKQ